METETVGNRSRKRSLLRELPTALSDITDTPKRRSSAKDKKMLEKVTFNTARDSLMWYRHASELVFNGACCANQTEICEALRRKFGYQNANEKGATRSCSRQLAIHPIDGRLLHFDGGGSGASDGRRGQSTLRNT